MSRHGRDILGCTLVLAVAETGTGCLWLSLNRVTPNLSMVRLDLGQAPWGTFIFPCLGLCRDRHWVSMAQPEPSLTQSGQASCGPKVSPYLGCCPDRHWVSMAWPEPSHTQPG